MRIKLGVVRGSSDALVESGLIERVASSKMNKRLYMTVIDAVDGRGRCPVVWEDRMLW